jgi:hypothetical protein
MEIPNARPSGEGRINIQPPSEAYQQAILSPVYRLSELMFGSLLAAYVLGFIGFAAANSQNVSPLPVGSFFSWEELYLLWEQALLRAPFFFISITFAYVTAGLYVAYHAGILTMHAMPLGRLSFDFALALSQALLFGISMLYPMAFPFWLGVTLIFASLRQLQEHKELVESFCTELKGTADTGPLRDRKSRERETLHKFKRTFKQLIKQYPLLSGWGPMPKLLIISGLVLMLLITSAGRFMIYIGMEKKWALFSISLLTCSVTVLIVHRILGRRANLLSQRMSDMDDQFNQLLAGLQGR